MEQSPRGHWGMATIRDKMGHCLHEFFTLFHPAWHPLQADPWGRLGLMSSEDDAEQAKLL